MSSFEQWGSEPTKHPIYDAWLFNQALLTQQLRDLSQQCFSVQPIVEEWQILRDDECQALNLPLGSRGWVREVYLQGRQQNWVYARSVAALSQLQALNFDLASLGTQSLGELLFQQHAFVRGPLQAKHYPTHLLPQAIHSEQPSNTYWARRSCFSHAALTILVMEVFLPQLWQAVTDNTSM
ncbi:chorismate lyase [Pseudomonas sp. F1_0610]|uniref:chorismate--pyruvate lyase family protein n=1 Tax=Pseudomonas sp. F1_0610 TaxID=3114284 RepID=UPI0039C395B5